MQHGFLQTYWYDNDALSRYIKLRASRMSVDDPIDISMEEYHRIMKAFHGNAAKEKEMSPMGLMGTIHPEGEFEAEVLSKTYRDSYWDFKLKTEEGELLWTSYRNIDHLVGHSIMIKVEHRFHNELKYAHVRKV